MAIKDRVLEMLENNKGKSISGNKIAMTLDVSRSAVWKAVNQLREDGYSINAGTNRGYCLTSDNDKLSEPAILSTLNTKYVGRSIDLFKTVDSTNSFAKSLAQLGAKNGHVIISEHQSMGRGRMGRVFYSPSCQGIYMSVIIRPKLSIEKATSITACAAVAVCQAIDKVIAEAGIIHAPCRIKWVNDIFLGDKKVCGILTEASVAVEQGGLDYVVIGFGLNVNNYSFPDELQDICTSLRLECGESFSRVKLCTEILDRFEALIEELTAGKSTFMSEYRNRSILTGKIIDVENNGITERFSCVGIDDQGYLVVRRSNGTELSLSGGTVTLVQ